MHCVRDMGTDDQSSHAVGDIDHIQSLQLLQPHLNRNTSVYLPYITNLQFDNPVFEADRCYLWTGDTKRSASGNHKSPHVPGENIYNSVVRRLFECAFGMKLPSKSNILRHMCPLITGEFNSGLCCNPLHLRIGTLKENSNDIRVHGLVKDLLEGKSTQYFCFEHNTTTQSSVGDWKLDTQDWRMLNILIQKRGLTLPPCSCDVMEISLPPNQDQVFLDKLMEDWKTQQSQPLSLDNSKPKRKYKRKKPTPRSSDSNDEKKEKRNARQRALREKKRADRDKAQDVDTIHVTVPADRPPLDVKTLWEEYVDSNPLPSGLLPIRTKLSTPETS